MALWETKLVFGGTAEGAQVDREHTFDIGQNINYRRINDVTTLNQKLSKDSATVVDALPHWITDLQGTIYTYLANGKIVERMASASWTVRKTVTSSVGQGFGVDPSYLYYTNASYVGRFPVSGTWGVDNVDTWNVITASSWNPVKYFAKVDLTLFGSKGELAVYDNGAANFSGSRLTMPGGWIIRDIEEWGDYVAISCWTGTNINQSSEGKMILWDGLSDTFNAVVDSEEGNILLTQKDGYNLNVIAGTAGNISRFESGQIAQKRKIPYINEDAGENIDIYPGAKCLWKGVPHIGVAGAGTAASLQRGVYSWGTNRNNVPNSLNLGYTISAGTTGTTTKVSALHTASDNQLFVGWEDNGTYGIDLLDVNTQADSGFIETLDFHGDRRQEGYIKELSKARLLFKPLTNGQSITLKVKADYSASWATVMTASSPGVIEMSTTQLANGTPFPVGRVFKQRLEYTSASSSAPSLISSRITYDPKITS